MLRKTLIAGLGFLGVILAGTAGGTTPASAGYACGPWNNFCRPVCGPWNGRCRAYFYPGWGYGYDSMRIREMSINSPIGIPIWQIKMLIPVGGALVALQGLAEVLRCIICLRDGVWAPRLHDVEELEKQLMEKAAEEGIEAAKAMAR